jgi:hypothetical protein
MPCLMRLSLRCKNYFTVIRYFFLANAQKMPHAPVHASGLCVFPGAGFHHWGSETCDLRALLLDL